MTRYQRASQIWSLLICAARERKTYTYGDIAKILGFRGAGVMAPLLGCIMWYCEEKGFPPLTVLVVNQELGLPGEGLSTLEEVNKDREAVFHFGWFSVDPPQCADFQAVDQNGVNNSKKTYVNDGLSKSPVTVFSAGICDKCGAPLLIDRSRGKNLLRCSAYPACKNIIAITAVQKREVNPKSRISVAQKEAFGDDHVICLICGKEMKTLTRHIKAAHNLKPGQYRKKFGIAASQSLSAINFSENSRKKAIARGQIDKIAAARAAKANVKNDEKSKGNATTTVGAPSRFVNPTIDTVNVFDDIKI